MTRTIRSARLIGRTDELKQFDTALSRAAEGSVSVLLVGGDAGIGKTRLLDEWGRRTADSGVRMLTGSCLEMGASSLPYAPVIEALRRYVADIPAPRRFAGRAKHLRRGCGADPRAWTCQQHL